MRTKTLWRVAVLATQRDGTVRGKTVMIYGPYQPKISMAVAIKQYDTDVEMDENDIEFSPVRIERIGVRELIIAVISSAFFGLIVGTLF